MKAYESAAKNRPALPAPTAAEEEKTEVRPLGGPGLA